MKFKRYLGVLLCLSFVLGQLNTYALFNKENNTVVKSNSRYISDGLVYRNSIEVCDNIRQEIHAFEYSPLSQTKIIPAYNDYIYGFNSVGKLISSYSGEGRVVGGINTDFFITSTGIPLSCFVEKGEIISSCDNRVAIGFDENGYAVIGSPEITSKIFFEDSEIPVHHINKTPSEWGIFLLTDKFSQSTKTNYDCFEIVLKPYRHSEKDKKDKEELFLDKYNLTNDDVLTNSTLNLVVADIFDSRNNGEIAENSFVLCVPKINYSHYVSNLKIGDEIILTTSVSDHFSNCESIFGAGSIILKDGEFVEQNKDSINNARHPRTAAGIKEDGTVIFLTVDGRRIPQSYGFTIPELSDYMKSLGCVDAVNFDGGGSTTFYASDIGELTAHRKNIPSGNAERSVANGMIFVNTSVKGEKIKYASIEEFCSFLYSKNNGIKISDSVRFADENYHPINLENAEVKIYVDERFGETDGDVFVPSGKTGDADVFAQILSDDTYETFKVGVITISDSADSVELSAEKSEISPFEEGTKLDFSAFTNTVPLEFSNSNIRWKLDVLDGFDESYIGKEIASIDTENMLFMPYMRGARYIVSARLGDAIASVEIYSEKIPFADMQEHWASRTSYDMYKKGLIIGEIDASGERWFTPSRSMTKTEFCVILSRILYPEIDTESDENEIESALTSDDVESKLVDSTLIEDKMSPIDNIPNWSRKYLEPLYENGHLDFLVNSNDNGEIVFNSGEYLTRYDVIRVLGSLMIDEEDEKTEKEEILFPDFTAQDERDSLYLSVMVENGIMTGYDDGTIRPDSLLTRAEAATVFSRFLSFEE